MTGKASARAPLHHCTPFHLGSHCTLHCYLCTAPACLGAHCTSFCI